MLTSPCTTSSGISVRRLSTSPLRGVAISTAVAVTAFNEGELSIYGFMKALQLHLTLLAFRSLCKREDTKVKNCDSSRKKKMDRRLIDTSRLKSDRRKIYSDMMADTVISPVPLTLKHFQDVETAGIYCCSCVQDLHSHIIVYYYDTPPAFPPTDV